MRGFYELFVHPIYSRTGHESSVAQALDLA